MITAITGPVCSGKTEYLIKKVNESFACSSDIEVYKPIEDTRNPGKLVSRNGEEFESKDLSLNMISNIWNSVIFIDEINLIPVEQTEKFIETIFLLCKQENIIYGAGLNLTSNMLVYPQMAAFMAIADDIKVLTASCQYCKGAAQYSEYIGKEEVKGVQDHKIGYDFRPVCFSCKFITERREYL